MGFPHAATTDQWGIDSGYYDITGRWHKTPPETRAAILEGMGVAEADDNPSAVEAEEPVRVVRTVQGGEPYPWPEAGTLYLEDGGRLKLAGALPPDLPWGYHDFEGAAGQRIRLIVSPCTCVIPSRPAWGWAVQLYAARSRESWGIGDLADLRWLGTWAKELGASFLLLCPLGAPAPVLSLQPSPYYPTSRQFLNPLYLRIEDVPRAEVLGVQLERLAAAGRALGGERKLDRDTVFRLKDEALRAIWAATVPDADFHRYCEEQGQPLRCFATFCALAQRWGGNWQRWPTEYRRPDSPAVAQFAAAFAREIAYYQWQQWLLDRQLATAAASVPLVQDMPIGVDPGGADAWAWQDLLALNCGIGAPPDPFNAQGQNWLLPPLVPHKLRAAGYEPFVQTVRALLRRAGGLRIDHVMGLFRLFWIPHGFGPDRGAYVRYRADELLAILAIESQRAGAFIVGEDLGTVEPAAREQLADHQILGFRVLWFESQPPARYSPLAMAAVTTHDLPTVAGLWTLIHELGEGRVPPHHESMQTLRQHLVAILGIAPDATVESVIESCYRRLAEAPCLLLVATLEDALAVREQPNVPGTVDQWPNWSLALPGGIEALQSSELPRRIAQALDRRNRNS
jgi:4-alpha-glucanotransferase